MVRGTNIVSDLQFGRSNFSSKTSKINYSDKATSEALESYKPKMSSEAKKYDFKEVLNSKVSYKDDDTKKTDSTDDSKGDVSKSNELKDGIYEFEELKEKFKKLEEESKSDSKENVEDILGQLLSLIAKLGIDGDELKQKGQLNSDALKNLLENIKENNSSNNTLGSTMKKLLELMKNDSVKDKLDTDSLKFMEKILNNLSSKIADDNGESLKDLKSSLKNLMSEISDILDNKQNGKILTLEDMLKNFSQDSKDGSLESQSNKNFNLEAGKNNKEVSKEDKFLNSLLDDKKDDSLNKINLFASRSQVIQNQSSDNVRGLTINKATFTNDFIKDVKFMSTNAMKELTVKVNPGDIGEITIKLIQEDGVMKANLKANSKEATALLMQNLADIKKQLNEQNIKIADVNIELYQEDTTFFAQQGFGRQLSEEQGRSSNSKRSNIVSNIAAIEELDDNNSASINNNIEFFA